MVTKLSKNGWYFTMIGTIIFSTVSAFAGGATSKECTLPSSKTLILNGKAVEDLKLVSSWGEAIFVKFVGETRHYQTNCGTVDADSQIQCPIDEKTTLVISKSEDGCKPVKLIEIKTIETVFE